jgi:quercetin dioxygenase-like cupin family protein
MFALRVKMPKGYSIPPHMHVRPEIVTVISGKFILGLGKAADHAGMEILPAGSFSSMPKGVVHYVFVDEDSVIQINAVGPWDIEYVNPKDDPRLNGAPEPPKSQLYSSEPR